MKTTNLKLVGLAMIATIATIAMTALIGSASAYAADKDMTSRAMVALSATAADRKAKQDLLSILQPARKYKTGMFQGVRGAGMVTKPHGTSLKGLCTMDSLILWYAPTAARSEPMDEPLRPTELTVKHLYHAVSGAEYLDDRGPVDKAASIANTWSRGCEKLRSDKTTAWFEADSVTEAMDAINALHAATDALRMGKLEASRCNYPLSRDETCSQAVLNAAYVDKIGKIGHHCQAAAGQSCFELYLNGEDRMEVTVVFSLKNNSPRPEDVVEVTVSEYVIVT